MLPGSRADEEVFKVGHELPRGLASGQGRKGGGKVDFVKVGGVLPPQPGGPCGVHSVPVRLARVDPDLVADLHKGGHHWQHRGEVPCKGHHGDHDAHGPCSGLATG